MKDKLNVWVLSCTAIIYLGLGVLFGAWWNKPPEPVEIPATISQGPDYYLLEPEPEPEPLPKVIKRVTTYENGAVDVFEATSKCGSRGQTDYSHNERMVNALEAIAEGVTGEAPNKAKITWNGGAWPCEDAAGP